ncbi:hypothetical protein EW146_g3062 [Bondarzewia mesenterica]|uniref:Macrofage activating glycoprotein n=1 Tax=Bondarzewia mesenterica TaxID=1095465 RepID=A0A4S4LZ04_9AGAM|nr:hypothetical protein EW146_g3062 [Bondarzewia mesenterica]
MVHHVLSAALLAVACSTYVAAQTTTQQFPDTPLANKHYSYPTGLPYKTDTDSFGRGTQFGYNMCNSTTENQSSLCQTSFVNHLDDFCLWAPSQINSTIADTEGEEVAWCSKKGHGTRVMPEGTLQGVQYLKTPDYILIAGFIDQTKMDIQAGDWGGELDPHGQDLRGNPMGGLMYSNAFGSANDNNTYTQVIEWTNFMGGNSFCIKVCDPAGANAASYCEHRLDRIGCAYNAPNNAQNGTFEICDSDNMEFPGEYVSNGVTMSYSQPPESLGAITTMPYTASVPASSNCVTFSSAALYTDLASVTASVVSTSTPSATASSSGSKATAGSASKSASGSAGATRSGSAASSEVTGQSSGAVSMGVSLVAGIAGVAFSVLALA